MVNRTWINFAEAAEILGVNHSRVWAKFKQGHFPSARRCECGVSWLILTTEVIEQVKYPAGRPHKHRIRPNKKTPPTS